MQKFNSEKNKLERIEEKLKNLDLPVFELPQRKKLLRLSLLNSPYFKKERFAFSFRTLAPSMGAVSVILIFLFLGYPYMQFFYLEAKASDILDKSEQAIDNLDPNEKVYVVSSGKGKLSQGFSGFSVEIDQKTISPEGLELLKESAQESAQISKTLDLPDQKLTRVELRISQLKEARNRGDIRFFQYAGEEKRDNTTLNKIRYVDRNNVITEIKIDATTNLPVEIISWSPKEEIRSPKAVNDALPESEEITEIRVFKISP